MTPQDIDVTMNEHGRISLSCLGIPISLQCSHVPTMRLLGDNFRAMQSGGRRQLLHYEIRILDSPAGGEFQRRGLDSAIPFTDQGELIGALEGDLVVQLQLLCRQHLFLHAAVLARERRAILLVGRSGAGKSTTCWGLLHHGFRYVSDELAPIDIATGAVLPYPHALCMKSPPPPEYPLPEVTRKTSRGFHIPVSAVPFDPIEAALPIESIFFVEHDSALSSSSITRISHAEATARLYPNILNALAHPNRGSDAAIRISKSAACYLSRSASLADTCRLITDA